MPPKCKFTREEILDAAMGILREKGADAITARALGERLGSSSKPVFSVFRNMEEVQAEVKRAAREVYNQYVQEGLSGPLAFKGVGEQYIRFASREPELFRLLFMTKQQPEPEISGILPVIEENYEKILSSIRDAYQLEEESAQRLYRHLWIYTHGIATLMATAVCRFGPEESSRMLTQVFLSLLNQEKGSRFENRGNSDLQNHKKEGEKR